MRSRSSLARFATWATIVVALLVVLFPFYWMLITAFKEYEQIRGLRTPFWPNPLSLGAFDRLLKAGKVRAIGASNFTVEQLTDALRVAETRLQQLRESGRARADQLAAAEEKVAGAQRGLHLAMRNVERATQEQTETQQRATVQMEEGARTVGRLSGAMDQLKERGLGAVAALGGAGLLGVLRNLGGGFADSARDAGQLATSMNATVGEAGAFLGLVGSLGLELNDLLEIQAEFAQKVTDNATDFQELGAQTQRNADGTVNWANTLVDFLEKLQGVEDATERNRLGFQFLGEEGYKQMSRLVASGVSVRDALEQIGTPITEEDVAMAAEYDAAMLDLSLTSTRTQQQLGRVLVPVLTAIAEGIGDVVDVVEEVPAPLALATAAAITLGVTGFNPTAAAGARLATVKAVLTREMALYSAAAATGTRATFLLAGSMGAASAAGGAMASFLGGPLGIALLALGAAYYFVTEGAEDFREASREAALEQIEAEKRYGDMAVTARELGQQLAEEAGIWDGLAASRRGASTMLDEAGIADYDLGGIVTTLTSLADQFTGGELAAAGFTDEIEQQRKELGAYGAQGELAQRAQKGLNDLIAEGTTEGAEFAEAVQTAADAQAAETRTSDLAAAAIDAYNAVTRDAVQTQLDLYNATLAQSDGLIGLQQTIHDAADVVDDLSTPWNEVAEATNKVISSALEYADTAADAAVSVARSNGTVVDSLTEAQLRGDATITALRESLNQPGLTDLARSQIGSMIAELEAAQEAGDIEAILRLTGAEETTSELDDATADRESRVNVESRGGPAVKRYLDGLAEDRLAIIRTESRNGPAVDDYLDRVARERLAIIRVESRNGPAVDEYLDRLAEQARTAYIDVRQRGAGSVGPGMRNAPGPLLTGAARTGGDTIIQSMTVVAQTDTGGRLTATGLQNAGREYVAAIRAYERRNGPGWRTTGTS